MKLNRITGSLAMAAAAVLFSGVDTATAGDGLPTYHATLHDDLVETVFPGVEYPGSWSTGLNENGDLVGQAMLNFDPEYGSRMQAFVYTVEHGVVAVPLAPGWGSNAVMDVSDRDANGDIIIVGGGVVGPYIDISIGEAALWRFSTVTGEFLETRLLGIPAGFDDSIAMVAGNDGIVVGFASTGPYVTWPITNWTYDIAAGVQETFDFPAIVTDMNNVGQVCGGVYRGDLFGNYEDLTDTYQPGDVMPWWAIENGGISAGWSGINDQGWLVGTAFTGISDGAGHYLRAVVRFADAIGWTGMPPISHLDGAGGINNLGDFTSGSGRVYFEDMGETQYLYDFIAPEWQPLLGVSASPGINDNRQVRGGDNHVWLLTPMGEMIIPGDVNGDVSVDLDDHCAWMVSPFDLDGDGDADADDEQWLVDRLLVFGHIVADCNGNGIGDHCDIVASTSLDCDLNGVPDECQPDCNGDGVPDICEADCNENGIPDPCDIATGASDDCNFNGIPDECDGGGVTEVSIVHDPPQFMYEDSVIVEDVLVTDAGIVDDVNLTLHYRYRIGRTTVELTHNGTTVTILDRPGHPQYTNGFVNFGYDAIVDDEGTGPFLETVGDYCCNFEQLLSPPSYRPNAPSTPQLSAFDGMPMQGIWTITITTTPDFSNGDGLHGWGLVIVRAAAAPGVCDCNGNRTPDDEDILAGTSADADGNGIPDECQTGSCPADVDGSAHVGFADLSTLLDHWGPCAPTPIACPCDLDSDGSTGFSDLSSMLAAWGPCD